MDLFQKITKLEKAAESFGLKWQNSEQIIQQILSEVEEVQEHLIHSDEKSVPSFDLEEELGDLLHAVLALCVYCKLPPEQVLDKTLTKFSKRLNSVKKIANDMGFNSLNTLSFEEQMAIWDQAKELAHNVSLK